jgi:hypothetical protein
MHEAVEYSQTVSYGDDSCILWVTRMKDVISHLEIFKQDCLFIREAWTLLLNLISLVRLYLSCMDFTQPVHFCIVVGYFGPNKSPTSIPQVWGLRLP